MGMTDWLCVDMRYLQEGGNHRTRKKDEASAKGTRRIKNERPAGGAVVHPGGHGGQGKSGGSVFDRGQTLKERSKGKTEEKQDEKTNVSIVYDNC